MNIPEAVAASVASISTAAIVIAFLYFTLR